MPLVQQSLDFAPEWCAEAASGAGALEGRSDVGEPRGAFDAFALSKGQGKRAVPNVSRGQRVHGGNAQRGDTVLDAVLAPEESVRAERHANSRGDRGGNAAKP